YRFAHWSRLSALPLPATLGSQVRADALFVGCTFALWTPALRKYLRPWMAAPCLIVLALCLSRFHSMIPFYESIVIGLFIAITSQHPESLVSRVLELRRLR